MADPIERQWSSPRKWYARGLVALFVFLQIHFTLEGAPAALRWSKEQIVVASFLLIALPFLYGVIVKKIKIDVRSVLFALGVIGVDLLAVLANQDFQVDSFIFVSVVLSGLFVCNLIYRDDYLQGYVTAMVVYSVYSILATYVLLPLAMGGAFSFPTATNALGTPFVDMGLAFAVPWFGLVRNQGIFREPGVFQFFILVALAIEMFYKSRRSASMKVILVLAITLMTTFSTAGLLCGVPLILLFLWSKQEVHSFKPFLVAGLLGLTVYALVVSNVGFVEEMSRSLVKVAQGSSNESFSVRYGSIFGLIQMSAHNPVFGSSFGYGFAYILRHYRTYGTNDITGTMFSFIMALGYPVGCWIVFNFYRFCALIGRNKAISIAVFLSLFAAINSQNLVYDTVVWTFIFMPYMRKSSEPNSSARGEGEGLCPKCSVSSVAA